MIYVNEYFDGAVKSLAYENDGKSTVGVIEKGEYEFAASTPETMLVIEGAMRVLLSNSSGWVQYNAGEKFDVPANTSFKVRVEVESSYLCKYK